MKPVSAILFLFVSFGASAQTIGEKISTLTLSDTIVCAAIDRPGDFYALTRSGQIHRFDKNGKLSLLYKAPQTPTLFDPRDGARLFVYYRQDQHYEFLSPSFQTTGSYKIDSAFAIHPWLICPSGEQRLWILDQADHSLKKVNVRDSVVEIEVRVDSTLIGRSENFKSMREYQNFVFLFSPLRGIFVFNSLGHHIRTIEMADIESFNFLGEELYYLRQNNLSFFNLFTADTRELPLNKDYTHALLTDERMILFTWERIDIFSFRP